MVRASFKHLVIAVLAILQLSGCRTAAGKPHASGAGACAVDGPEQQRPAILRQLRVGMPRSAVEGLLGPPTYSPFERQYYYVIGGDCWVEELGRAVPCGVVADYRRDGTGPHATERLASCWWGPIAE